MANVFITPTVIAARGLATLYNNTLLAALVSRDYDGEFTGKIGDTVTVRKPATFVAENFDKTTRDTNWQDASEDSVDVKLDTIKHVPFYVNDEQMTQEVSDFQTQLLTPAMEAIAQGIDGDIAEKLVDVAEGAGGGGTVSITGDPDTPDAPNWVFRKGREKLTRNKLPGVDRHAVLSPEAVTSVLGDVKFLEADKSGSTDALREAIIGRAFGFETYEAQVFGYGSGNKGQADGVGFHRSAIIAAIRPLQKPRGVAAENAAVENWKGLSLRVVYSYDEDAKQDKVVIDTLYGLTAAYAEGAVVLNFGQGS
jgi:hypothetical protein